MSCNEEEEDEDDDVFEDEEFGGLLIFDLMRKKLVMKDLFSLGKFLEVKRFSRV